MNLHVLKHKPTKSRGVMSTGCEWADAEEFQSQLRTCEEIVSGLLHLLEER